MRKLIFYLPNGAITRIMSSSLPASQWVLANYGLSGGEKMKLFDSEELPLDIATNTYLYYAGEFSPILQPKTRDIIKEFDDLEIKLKLSGVID